MGKFNIKRMHLNLLEKIFFVAYVIYLVFGILSTTFYYKYYAGIPHKSIHMARINNVFYVELFL